MCCFSAATDFFARPPACSNSLKSSLTALVLRTRASNHCLRMRRKTLFFSVTPLRPGEGVFKNTEMPNGQIFAGNNDVNALRFSYGLTQLEGRGPMFGNLFQGWHLLIVLAVILLIFGAPKLPGLARSLGQSMRIFRSEVRTMKEESSQPENTTPSETKETNNQQ